MSAVDELNIPKKFHENRQKMCARRPENSNKMRVWFLGKADVKTFIYLYVFTF